VLVGTTTTCLNMSILTSQQSCRLMTSFTQATGQQYSPGRESIHLLFASSTTTTRSSLFIIGGLTTANTALNDIWQMSDNNYWINSLNTNVAFPARWASAVIVDGANRLWVMGGLVGSTTYNDVYSINVAALGGTWTQQPQAVISWTPRSYAQALTVPSSNNLDLLLFNGFTISPIASQIYRYFANNISWSLVSSTTSTWSTRVYYSVCNIGNTYLYMGGTLNFATNYNDIWSSNDEGKTFTKYTVNAAWSQRYAQALVVYGTTLIVSGGYTGSINLNDIWLSSDIGLTWWLAMSSSNYPSRRYHTMAVLNGQLTIVGGYSGSAYLTDTWSFPLTHIQNIALYQNMQSLLPLTPFQAGHVYDYAFATHVENSANASIIVMFSAGSVRFVLNGATSINMSTGVEVAFTFAVGINVVEVLSNDGVYTFTVTYSNPNDGNNVCTIPSPASGAYGMCSPLLTYNRSCAITCSLANYVPRGITSCQAKGVASLQVCSNSAWTLQEPIGQRGHTRKHIRCTECIPHFFCLCCVSCSWWRSW